MKNLDKQLVDIDKSQRETGKPLDLTVVKSAVDAMFANIKPNKGTARKI